MDCNRTKENCLTKVDRVNSTLESIPEWEAVVTGVVLSAITLFTIVGNILVILSVFRYRPLRIPPNYFIASLAVTDITIALLVFPFSIGDSINGRWVFGAEFCKVWLALNALCCSASIFHLCAIALDRYWAIKDPIAYAEKRTVRRILTTIGLTWFTAGALSSFLLFDAKEEATELIEKMSVCLRETFNNFIVSMIIAFLYLSLCVTTILYVQMFLTVRRRIRDRAKISYTNHHTQRSPGTSAKGIQRKPSNAEGSDSTTSEGEKFRVQKALNNETELINTQSTVCGLESIPESGCSRGKVLEDADRNMNKWWLRVKKSRNCKDEVTHLEMVDLQSPSSREKPAVHLFFEEKQRVSQRKEKRLARTLGLVMGAFIMCWLPYFIFHLVIMLCKSCPPSFKIRKSLTWMGYINSTLNPIIYTLFNAEFRTAFRKILHL